MENYLTFATQLAFQTGQLLRDSFRTTGYNIQYKADHSVVTEADLAADELISRAIRKHYPDEGLLSEELQPETTHLNKAVWVVDPLDGTTNFSLGLPIWGVSIARLVDGWPTMTAIYFPMLDELYTAQKGEGSSFNNTPLHLTLEMVNQTTTFFACCSRTHRHFHITIPYKTRILGSASYNFCILGRGIALTTFEARAKIWDIAGAWLVVKEAGGEIETWDGSTPFPLLPGIDYRKCSFPVLAAPTPGLLAQARIQIQPKDNPITHQ
jgi:myo-inositol-1(or 4)-monophosphatase